MKDIKELALKACELLEKKPIDQAEVAIFSSDSIEVEIEKLVLKKRGHPSPQFCKSKTSSGDSA